MERGDRGTHGVGLCECGCGEETRIAPQTCTSKGWIRGEPLRFKRGHALRVKQRPPLGAGDFTEEDRGHKTPCWIRVGGLSTKGYGKVTIAGRVMYAHRAMYEQEVGPIPDGMTIDHLCCVRACMRPDHLEAVPMATNLRRGRGAKITEEIARAIREAPAEIETKALAARYGLSASHVSRVRRGLKWREVMV